MTEHENAKELTPDEMRADPDAVPTRQHLEPNEMTSWDGTGNPIKHVLTDDEGGHLSEGTGQSTDEAAKEAREPDSLLGEEAGPEPEGNAP